MLEVVNAAKAPGAWDWVGPFAQILTPAIAIATLIWTRLPDTSRLRRIERLTAIVKDLDAASSARAQLQGVIDAQATMLADRYAPKEQKGKTENRVRTAATIVAILALFFSGVAGLTFAAVNLSHPTASRPGVAGTANAAATWVSIGFGVAIGVLVLILGFIAQRRATAEVEEGLRAAQEAFEEGLK